MKRTFLYWLSVLAIVVCPWLSAGESEGPVTQIFVNKPNPLCGNNAGAVMFSAGQHTNKPACSHAATDWTIPLDSEWGRAMYSLLLTAAASGKPVKVYGTGTCDVWSDRESVNVILIDY